jgi:hypothetical protein
MADLAPNPDVNAVAVAQQVVAQVADVPLEGINFMLDTIGFNNPAQCLLIVGAGLTECEDFCHLINKDISDMAEEFLKCTVAAGRMTFGMGRTKNSLV